MTSIPVFMSSDNNFAPFVATTIASILKNTQAYIDFYILDCGISNKNKKKIQNTDKYFENFSIEFLPINVNQYFTNFPEMEHITKAMYSRFLIPELKPGLNKIIYIDVDIIFKNDIEKLYKIDLDKFALAAPSIYRIKEAKNTYNTTKERLQLSDFHKQFCSGVLLIDCNKWNKEDVTKQLLKLTSNLSKEGKLVFPDQDVLNKYFDNNYLGLDIRYNVIYKSLKQNFSKDKIQEILKNQVICHFTGGGKSKPWNNKNIEGAEYFWEYVKYTDFKYEIEIINKIFIIKSFFQNIFNFFHPFFRRGKNFIKNKIIKCIKK